MVFSPLSTMSSHGRLRIKMRSPGAGEQKRRGIEELLDYTCLN